MNQAELPVEVLLLDATARGEIAFRVVVIATWQREANESLRNVVDVMFAVGKNRQVCFEHKRAARVSKRRAELAGFHQRN